MKRLYALVSSLVVLLVLSVSPLSMTASAQTPIVVKMTDAPRFSPGEVHIKQGQSVQWVNVSQIVHSVTTDRSEALYDDSVELPDGAQPFNSGILDPGETFTRTFNQPGTYQYVCIVHEGIKMTGRVVVEPAE